MQVKVNRKGFLDMLRGVAPATPRNRSSLPMLQGVHLEARAGTLTATASDLEVALRTSLAVQIIKAGAVVVPATVAEFVKSSSGDTITITSKGASVTLAANGAQTTVEGQLPADYPVVPKELKGTDMRTIGCRKLGDAMRQVIYAVSPEDSRVSLTGLLFDSAQGAIVGADGFRLAVATLKGWPRNQEPFILPHQAAVLALKLLGNDMVLTTCKQGNRRDIALNGNGLTLITYAVEATFPDYKQLIPEKKGLTRLNVKASDLLAAVNLVVGKYKRDQVPVRLETKGGKLRVSALWNERKSLQTVPARGQVKVCYAGNYLLDLLSRLTGEITLYSRTSSPGMVVQNGTTHLVMPLYVKWD